MAAGSSAIARSSSASASSGVASDVRVCSIRPGIASEVAALIKAAIAEAGATSIKEMGKVMALVKQRAAGQADMAVVSAQIKAALSG